MRGQSRRRCGLPDGRMRSTGRKAASSGCEYHHAPQLAPAHHTSIGRAGDMSGVQQPRRPDRGCSRSGPFAFRESRHRTIAKLSHPWPVRVPVPHPKADDRAGIPDRTAAILGTTLRHERSPRSAFCLELSWIGWPVICAPG